MKMTTTDSYEIDLNQALVIIAANVDLNDYDGNQRNWSIDALNDSWVEGITIADWVKRAMTAIVSGRTQEPYRFDQYDAVYEYNEVHQTYLFVGKLLGRTHAQFIADYKSDLDYCAYKAADRAFDDTEFDYSQF